MSGTATTTAESFRFVDRTVVLPLPNEAMVKNGVAFG
jgi:hypothetical protein